MFASSIRFGDAFRCPREQHACYLCPLIPIRLASTSFDSFNSFTVDPMLQEFKLFLQNLEKIPFVISYMLPPDGVVAQRTYFRAPVL